MLLYCLPFAGGSSHSYRGLFPHLERFITPRALEMPGRGGRSREALLTGIEAMVEDAFAAVSREISSQPYAFYGHSMGAIVGFLLTRKIMGLALPPPKQLFFSGRTGPTVPDRVPGRHLLPRDQFLAMLHEFEGSPPEVLANRELMDYFEPILRADFQASESFRYGEHPPLPVPVTVMYGQREGYSHGQFLAWQRETSHPLKIRPFPGGHFFIFDHFAEIGEIISTTLGCGNSQ